MRATLMWMSVEVVSGVRIVQCHAIIDVVIDVRVAQCHTIIDVVIGVRVMLCHQAMDIVIGVRVMLCHQAIDNSGFSTFLNFPLRVQILILLSCCINSSSLFPVAILCTLLHRENKSFEVWYYSFHSVTESLLPYLAGQIPKRGEHTNQRRSKEDNQCFQTSKTASGEPSILTPCNTRSKFWESPLRLTTQCVL